MRTPTTCNVKDADLEELLQNPTFVDYFNVFLSLPRFVYKFQQKDFELDPPLKKSKYILDKKQLIHWLSTERLPLFKTTHLFHELVLCMELLNTNLYMVSSSHNFDYENYRHLEDEKFLQNCCGNVIGMRHFRHYMAGTTGERLLRFWLDVEHFQSLPDHDLPTKWNFYREIQFKYFKGKSHGAFDLLSAEKEIMFHDLWLQSKNFRDTADIDASKRYADTTQEDFQHIMKSTDYRQIQTLIIAVLKEYWLQKYAIHCKLTRDKLLRESASKESVYNIRSQSALEVLKDVKEIDKALRLVQGDLQCDKVVRKRMAKYNWRKMFPENTIDGSFLNEDGHLVTLHADGTISIDAIDDSLDEMLRCYLATSSDGEESSRKPTGTEDTSLQSSRCISTASSRVKSTPVLPTVERTSSGSIEQASSISRISDSKDEPYTMSNSDVSISFTSSVSSSASDVHKENSFIKVIQDAIEEHERKLPEQNENSSLTSQLNLMQLQGPGLMRDIARAHLKKIPSELSVDNLKLFDYLLKLDGTGAIPSKSSTSSNMLPTRWTSVLNASSQSLLGSKSKLPSITPNGEHSEETSKLSVISEELELCQKWVGKSYEEQCLKRKVEILPPVFEYKNKCEGYFRFDNSLSLLGIACDAVAGNPFQKYLYQLRCSKELINLCFWKEAELYLSNSGETEDVQVRRAKLLVVRYLLNSKVSMVPGDIKALLLDLLSHNKGSDLLREAQDHACQKLLKHLESFNRKDKQKFIDCCILKKDGKKMHNTHNISVSKKTSSSMQSDQVPAEKVGNIGAEELKDRIANENMLVRDDKNLLSRDSERRMLLAVQLALHAASKSDDGLPLDPLKVEDLEWDAENEHGSLCVKKLIRIKRRDLVEYKRRLRELVKRKKECLELERLRLADKAKPNVQTDDTPFYMKPFKRVGLWYHRPSRPRTFQDVMEDPVNREFFRRYLIYNDGELPMNFYNSVEDLKNSKEARTKQNKMTQITRKYFSTVPSAMEMLNTNADIVQAIPTQVKVTMAMFISAQSWVARALHDNWFDKYQHTFPEHDRDSVGNLRLQNNKGARQWGKHKTKLLWHQFVHTVIKFRADILEPKSANHFEKFLKAEVKREIESQGYIPGMPLRKVIRNKLVDVTKLVSDMHFIAESDRFRTMCDDARNNADSGAYCIEEEKMLENKAKMIVDCFIDSDIPPRVQINLTQKQTDLIMHNFKSGLLDRSLFYQATVNIFPCIIYLWRKFQRYKFTNMYDMWQKTLRAKKNEVERQLTEVTEISEPPDYINSDIQSVTVKRVIPTRGIRGAVDDSEQCRLTFSMSQGMKMLIPMYAQANLPLGSQEEPKGDGDMNYSSGLNINRPSFLKNRRDALINSKASVKMSSHMQSNVTSKRRNSTIGARRSSQARPVSQMSGRHLNPSSPREVTMSLVMERSKQENSK